MTNDHQFLHAGLSDDPNQTFLIRWRGRQDGPYTAAIIEEKLAGNKIGLLHEISSKGHWLTLRDYLAERDTALRAQVHARQEQERRAREEAERQAREKEAQRHAELVEEQRRKNDLTQLSLAQELGQRMPQGITTSQLEPHRAGTILTFAILGLLVCAPFGVAAWVMASNDLARMDAGLMDRSGYGTTSSAKVVAIIATALWGLGFLVFALASLAN